MLRKFFAAALIILAFPLHAFALDAPYDHSLFDQFLKEYVNEKGNLDYAAAKKDPHLLEEYIQNVRNLSWGKFQGWPREEQMALLLNIYHAGMIQMILSHYPVSSVQKIPGFWQMDAVNIDDKHFGLNVLREKFLIKRFREAKIHTALSYASLGGPHLSRDAYQGPTVEAQLLMAASAFVNDPQKNQIEAGKKKIYLSKIFEWHSPDFTLDYGAFENEKNLSQRDYSVLSFIAHHLQDEEKIGYLEDGRFKIKYLQFDWSLNDSPRAPAKSQPAAA